MDARRILPRHEVTDPAKVERIATSLRADGWTGRPVVVVAYCDTYRALTGTHRLAAAVLAEVAVPTYEVEWSETIEAALDDDDLLAALLGAGDAEGADLMRVEIRQA